jgi:Tfp pilus assembly protein PilN
VTTPDITGSHAVGDAHVDAPATPFVLPRVNLMPAEIAEAARFRRFQFAMGGAVLAAMTVVGALYVHQHSAVKGAQADLDVARAQQATLQSKLSTLSSVQDVYTQVASRQTMLAQAMGSEVRWSYYLTDLSLKVPDNVWLTNITATQSDQAAAPVAGAAVPATPGAPTSGIGTITFAGTAFSHNDVASWLDMLGRERGFADAYFTNSTESAIGTKKVANFTSSVTVTDAAKSNRFNAPAGS